MALPAHVLALIPFAGLFLAGPAAKAAIERTVEKTFTVQPGGEIRVSTAGGDIEVVTGSPGEVNIIARERFHHVSDDREADEVASHLKLDLSQTGDRVNATAKYEGASGWFGRNRVDVSFRVTVPSGFTGNLTTSGGDVIVRGPLGSLRATTSGGDITTTDAAGDLDLSTSGGDIEVVHAQGQVKARTSGGEIKLDQVAGPVDGRTSGGDISVVFTGSVGAPCTLSTSGGDVDATFVPAAAFDLTARTSGGEVETKGVPVTVESGAFGKSRVSGKVNGGGPEVKLQTSGGDITLHRG